MHNGNSGGIVVITGCSTGIGAAAAKRLKAAGWRVIATARKPQDVEALAAAGYDAVALDIADAASTATAADRMLALSGGRVDALVNNAGFGQSGAVEDITRDALRYQFEVNLIGMQDLTNRLLPAMRRQGGGRIVNISSVLGRVSLPYMGVYAATKHAMEAMSDAMRVELRRTGIRVVLVEPGPIATEFRRNAAANARQTLDFASGEHAGLYRQVMARREDPAAKPDPFTLPPEAVACAIERALTDARPKRRYRVTLPAHIGEFMRRFLPDGITDWIMGRQAG